MKERRYFYCQRPEHITANCLKSITKVAIVTKIASTAIDNNKKFGKK